MTERKICPYCYRENPPYVERCEHCGRPFSADSRRTVTTEKVAKTEPELTGGLTAALPSIDHLDNLARNTLVLFISGEEKPILLENLQEVILGRPIMEIPTERTFDLTNYGAVTLGVSRRHARITYVNGTFTVVDLGSTNGTTLNSRFLPPNHSQQLRPFDHLTLGQLRLMVYFKVREGEKGKNFLLTDKRPAPSWSLTPDYLSDSVMPYIHALAEIEKVIREVRGQPDEGVQVLYIQTGERPAQLRLKLLMADEAIDVVRQWIGPWQHIHAAPSMISSESSSRFLMPQIRDLVASIANHLLISFSELETYSVRERLFAPVSFIATSGLELTLEASQS